MQTLILENIFRYEISILEAEQQELMKEFHLAESLQNYRKDCKNSDHLMTLAEAKGKLITRQCQRFLWHKTPTKTQHMQKCKPLQKFKSLWIQKWKILQKFKSCINLNPWRNLNSYRNSNPCRNLTLCRIQTPTENETPVEFRLLQKFKPL